MSLVNHATFSINVPPTQGLVPTLIVAYTTIEKKSFDTPMISLGRDNIAMATYRSAGQASSTTENATVKSTQLDQYQQTIGSQGVPHFRNPGEEKYIGV